MHPICSMCCIFTYLQGHFGGWVVGIHIPAPSAGIWLEITDPKLGGGLEHVFIPFSWEFHHPNWRSHTVQRGRYTTIQKRLMVLGPRNDPPFALPHAATKAVTDDLFLAVGAGDIDMALWGCFYMFFKRSEAVIWPGTMYGPRVISWFKNPSNCSCKCHKISDYKQT